MDGIPSEIELQKIFGFSKIEADMYEMKLNGIKYAEIAEYHNVSLQSVKQTIYNATKKMKGRMKMNIIVIYDSKDPLTRKSTAEMALRVLDKDLQTGKFYVGKHTMFLGDVPSDTGDINFLHTNVIPYCEILSNNPNEAREKADKFYDLYLKKGGVKGKLGVGFLQYVFTKYYIKYDIF